MNRFLLVVVLVGFLQACGDDRGEAASNAQAPDIVRYGQVLESLDVEGYTYLLLDEHGKQVWVAASPIWVETGAFVRFIDGGMANNYYSEELNRNFDFLYFAKDVELVSEEVAADFLDSGLSAIDYEDTDESPTSALEGSEEEITIEPLNGGATVASLFEGYGQAAGQVARFRAKVVKVNKEILGRNWVTLIDGTGVEPNNKIVATTAESPAVGDIVIVEGIIEYDQNIGYGYAYRVLITGASFTK